MTRNRILAANPDAAAIKDPYTMMAAEQDQSMDAPELASRADERDSAARELEASPRGQGSPAGCASCRTGSPPTSAWWLLLGPRARRRRWGISRPSRP